MDDKLALITGAPSGISLELAKYERDSAEQSVRFVRCSRVTEQPEVI